MMDRHKGYIGITNHCLHCKDPFEKNQYNGVIRVFADIAQLTVSPLKDVFTPLKDVFTPLKDVFTQFKDVFSQLKDVLPPLKTWNISNKLPLNLCLQVKI